MFLRIRNCFSITNRAQSSWLPAIKLTILLRILQALKNAVDIGYGAVDISRKEN